MRIIQTVRDSGRALVIAFNKWDLVDEERRYYLDREIERDLVQVQWAPRINVTARTGWHIDRLVPALEKALEGWETRVSTGQLNSFLGRLVAEHPHPVRSGKQPKVLFGTQATTSPPTFVLFTSGKLDAGYERFIERRLREEFGFVGTPDRRSRCGRGRSASAEPRSAVTKLRIASVRAQLASTVPICVDFAAPARAARWRRPAAGRLARPEPTAVAAPVPRRRRLPGVPGEQLVEPRHHAAAGARAQRASGSRTCRRRGSCTRTSGRRTATVRTTASRSRSSAPRTRR